MSWQNRPKYWQLQCADVVSEADPTQATSLLQHMIRSQDDDIALQAADSLRVLHGSEGEIEVSKQVFERLQSLFKKYGGLSSKTIEELLTRVNVNK